MRDPWVTTTRLPTGDQCVTHGPRMGNVSPMGDPWATHGRPMPMGHHDKPTHGWSVGELRVMYG